MGQKTNPIGFRLQITKKWKSRWYGDGDSYADFLHQDLKIRRFIEKELRAAGVVKIEIERTSGEVNIDLHVAKPGIVIGRGGARVESLKEKIKEILGGAKLRLNVQQIKRSDVSARLLAEEIAQQLERRIPYKRAVSRTLAKAMESSRTEGIKIAVSGRLNGVRIARTEKKSQGRVPLQTITADIDYAQVDAHTKYGLIGVKVWLNKKPEKQYA